MQQPDITRLKSELFYALRELNCAIERAETVEEMRALLGMLAEFSAALTLDGNLPQQMAADEALSLLRVANDRLARVCRIRMR